MSSLQEQLCKAGLVGKKQKAHQERRRRKKAKKRRMGAGADPQEEARRGALQEQRREREEARVRRVADEQARGQEHERRVQVRNLIHSQDPVETRPGSRRFCHPTRGARIRWLYVTEATAALLERGDLGVVEDPFGHGSSWHIVPRGTLERMIEVDGSWIMFWNGHPDHAGLPQGSGEEPPGVGDAHGK